MFFGGVLPDIILRGWGSANRLPKLLPKYFFSSSNRFVRNGIQYEKKKYDQTSREIQKEIPLFWCFGQHF